jgi:hypothetical protein
MFLQGGVRWGLAGGRWLSGSVARWVGIVSPWYCKRRRGGRGTVRDRVITRALGFLFSGRCLRNENGPNWFYCECSYGRD